ncbi:MAG: GntR family transcriptional regulator [Bacteroidales bacterium]|nr:GntR family transcriptional regulator [Bacteroidales bacterium]
MARIPQHKRLYNLIKHDILSGTYEVGDLLPTEYEFASRHKVARSTVRQALAALEKEGHIEKRQGKGSMVAEGGRKIGLLNIRGFSSVVPNPSNDFLLKPHEITWPDELKPYLTKEQTESNCIFIKRLRRIDNKPIALELTYLPNIGLPDFAHSNL